MKSVGLDVNQTDSIANLPVSNIFKANFWRLVALTQFKKLQKEKHGVDIKLIENKIKTSVRLYT